MILVLHVSTMAEVFHVGDVQDWSEVHAIGFPVSYRSIRIQDFKPDRSLRLMR